MNDVKWMRFVVHLYNKTNVWKDMNFLSNFNINMLKRNMNFFSNINIPKRSILDGVKNINFRKFSSDFAPTGSRPMKFPYTFTAKIVQFPIKHYVKHNWMYKYYLIAVIVSAPVFQFCGNLSNTPDNVRKWAEIRAGDEHHEH